MSDLTISDDTVTMSAARCRIAIEASYELEQMAEIVKSQGGEGNYYVVRGLALRLKELSSIIMSALDDRVEPTEEIFLRLTGDAAPANCE